MTILTIFLHFPISIVNSGKFEDLYFLISCCNEHTKIFEITIFNHGICLDILIKHYIFYFSR